MTDVAENFKINLNQNLWGLIVSYATVGLSERYGFHQLWWLAFVVSCMMSCSVFICLIFYPINYCKKKLKD